jgi:hypothetical protein
MFTVTIKNMSGQGFPFQQDALALSRWDYCQSPYAVPDNNDPLSCSLRARQCGSHIASTGNRALARRVSGPLSEILEPPLVTGWAGGSNCLTSNTRGTCGLLTSERYGDDLWRSIGKTRARWAYDEMSGVTAPHAAATTPSLSTIYPATFASPEWLIAHYR